jgi:hypothetical protein
MLLGSGVAAAGDAWIARAAAATATTASTRRCRPAPSPPHALTLPPVIAHRHVLGETTWHLAADSRPVAVPRSDERSTGRVQEVHGSMGVDLCQRRPCVEGCSQGVVTWLQPVSDSGDHRPRETEPNQALRTRRARRRAASADVTSFLAVSRGDGNRIFAEARCTQSEVPAPDHQPQRQQEFAHEREGTDIGPRALRERGAEAVKSIADTCNGEQDAQEPGDIPGSIREVAERAGEGRTGTGQRTIRR